MAKLLPGEAFSQAPARPIRTIVRRIGSIPAAFLVAIGVALVVGIGVYALAGSSHPTAHAAGGAPTVSSPAAAASTPTQHLGARLLASAKQAYVHIPAVVVTAQVGGQSFRFTEILRRGTVVKAAYFGAEGDQTTTLVAPNGTPTFAREPGSSCWRTLSASDPQSLSDVGQQFPPIPSTASVRSVTARMGGWVVQTTADGHEASFLIDPAANQVLAVTVATGAGQVTEHIQALAAAPRLPAPMPHC